MQITTRVRVCEREERARNTHGAEEQLSAGNVCMVHAHREKPEAPTRSSKAYVVMFQRTETHLHGSEKAWKR